MAISRRAVIRVVSAGAVLAGAGAFGLSRCDLMPDEAVEAWGGPGARETDPRRRALAYALLAPNPHNTQAWIADLRTQDRIVFTLDRTRLLPATDPYSRQIAIGCGCFLELLRMAAAEDGIRAEIALFPDGAWPDGEVGDTPLARVDFIADASVTKDPLFPSAQRRRTNRKPFDAEALRGEHAAAIVEAIDDPAIRYEASSAAGMVSALKNTARQAWTAEYMTARTHQETVNYLRVGASEIAAHRDGILLHGPDIWWAKMLGLITPEALSKPGSIPFQNGLDQYIEAIEGTASFGWFSTAANDRAAQVAAGRAYLRIALTCAGLGVALHPLSQALQEFPEVAEQMRAIRALTQTPDGHTLQMFFRLGYGPTTEPAPRRKLADIVRA